MDSVIAHLFVDGADLFLNRLLLTKGYLNKQKKLFQNNWSDIFDKARMRNSQGYGKKRTGKWQVFYNKIKGMVWTEAALGDKKKLIH
jgi:hypothetical protein